MNGTPEIVPNFTIREYLPYVINVTLEINGGIKMYSTNNTKIISKLFGEVGKILTSFHVPK